MRIPKFKKKFIAGALAAGLVMGAGGIAAAYLATTGSGTGTATVGTPTTVSVKSISASTWGPGTAKKVAFSVTNPNSYTVHLATKATISAHSITGCTTATADSATVTVTTATTAIGSLTNGTHAISTATEEPSFTVATTSGHTQAGCVLHLTIHV